MYAAIGRPSIAPEKLLRGLAAAGNGLLRQGFAFTFIKAAYDVLRLPKVIAPPDGQGRHGELPSASLRRPASLFYSP